MKVTVTFGDRAVVVPCKPGWTVRDLMEQATRRYRRILDQDGRSGVNTHHLEYTDGGILDIDDLLTDLVEDRDKLVALFEVQRGTTDSPRESISNGESSAAPSPEPLNYYSHLQLQEPIKGEIEVNEAVLKSNTPLLVRSSSESALAPPIETTTPPEDRSTETFKTGTNHVLRGGAEQATKMSLVTFSALTRTVHLLGDRGPLGIQVVPYCSSLSGRMLGLLITNIEDNSRTKKENIFQEDECIVHIDGISLQDKTFADSQELFRQALSSPSMHLEVLPVANKPRYEKGLIGQLFNGEGKELKAKSPVVTRANIDLQPVAKQESKANPASRWQKAAVKTRELPAMNPVASNPQSAAAQARNAPLERVSPTSLLKMASASSPTRTRRQSPPASKSSNVPELTNKKGSKRIKVDLKKGAEGLGFTVVTRDSANGPGPILVKSILPRGAAVKDGRLQPGDRILEVNNMDMTGRSQEELVAMLRGTRQGESVCVVVARQEDIFLPRELKGEDDSSRVLEDGREQLVYEIPLNETGSAGLGVSLKGNKSRETGEDLGIFIKSIIHGGAAYKDGRLRVNDQLIAVNGEALLGRSNHTAMETLRRSMSSEGNTRGTIQLVVLRACRVEGRSISNCIVSQLKPHVGSDNQVGAANTSQPPPPQRSSSLLPPLWRRASGPLPHSRRQRYTLMPGETHTRYTYGLNLRERPTCYTFGLAHAAVQYVEDASGCRPAYEFGLVPRPGDETWNTEYRYAHDGAKNPTLAHMPCDPSLAAHPCPHSRAHDSLKSNAYTENIRAMAGQMYAHRNQTSTQRHGDTHSQCSTHKHAFTPHHDLQLSGGL